METQFSIIWFLLTTLWLVTEAASMRIELRSDEWVGYKKYFNKTYNSDVEEYYRYGVWKENSHRIEKHNFEADLGKHRFWLKMNHLGDMKTEEINLVMNKLRIDIPADDIANGIHHERKQNKAAHGDNRANRNRKHDGRHVTRMDYGNSTDVHDVPHKVPDKVDWRTKGYVTPVKYQGHCGACYAFSATGALEGQHFRKTGKLVSLSEQNFVDCTYYNKYHDHGCHGGLMDHAFKYVIDIGGVDTEASYPYTARLGRCHFTRRNIGATAKGYKDILPRGDENKLKEAVGTLGPVSIGIDAHGFGFHFYSHGIYDSWFCSSHRLNHGVLAVGYDSYGSGRDYWIVKNSWGSWWGLHGYVQMSRNKENQCGIASLASIPIV